MMQPNIFPIARDQRSSAGSNRNGSETAYVNDDQDDRASWGSNGSARPTMSDESPNGKSRLSQSANISRSVENAVNVYESYSSNRPPIRGRRSQAQGQSRRGGHRDLSNANKRGRPATLSTSSNYVAYENPQNQTLPMNFSSKHNDGVLNQLVPQRRPLTIQPPPTHQKQVPSKSSPPTNQNKVEQAKRTLVIGPKPVVTSTSQEEEQPSSSTNQIERRTSTPQPIRSQESSMGRLLFQMLQLAIEDEQPSVFKNRFMGYVHANYSVLSELSEWQNFAVENPRLLMQILSSKPSDTIQST
ncbi:hypothetical protein M3Y95_01071100 [Aphelenchoides besseyi]|nr:hypothetical protein M3Y95_01071100 [Aphelenchoides besseyi]